MRVVFDTSVLVAAVRSRQGASFALISSIPTGDFQLCLSIGLYLEWQAVLTRAENRLPGTTEEDALGFLRYLASQAHLQEIHFLGSVLIWPVLIFLFGIAVVPKSAGAQIRFYTERPKTSILHKLTTGFAGNNLRHFGPTEIFNIDAQRPLHWYIFRQFKERPSFHGFFWCDSSILENIGEGFNVHKRSVPHVLYPVNVTLIRVNVRQRDPCTVRPVSIIERTVCWFVILISIIL